MGENPHNLWFYLQKETKNGIFYALFYKYLLMIIQILNFLVKF